MRFEVAIGLFVVLLMSTHCEKLTHSLNGLDI